MGQLEEYIKESLKRGYTPDQIREVLVQSGYSRSVVNKTFQQSNTTHALFSTNKKRISILLFFFFCILGFLVYFYFLSTPQITFQIVPPLQQEYIQGDTLVFERTLTTTSNKKINVAITYILIDSSEKIFLQKKEEFFLSKQNSAKVSFPIYGETKLGTYVLKSTLQYDNIIKEARFPVVIKVQPVLSSFPAKVEFEPEVEIKQTCPTDCDDYNTCTQDVCQGGVCSHQPKVPCCGNGNCELGENGLTCVQDCSAKLESPVEIEQKAVYIAQQDISLAINTCMTLIQKERADACVYKIAVQQNNSVICASIQDGVIRDNCGMDFALKGDFSTCETLQNPYLQSSCFALERIKNQQNLLQTSSFSNFADEA